MIPYSMNRMGVESTPYTELQYLESTGVQWIDTGINADNNLQVEFDLQFTDISATASFGAIRRNVSAYTRHHLTLTTATTTYVQAINTLDLNVPKTLSRFSFTSSWLADEFDTGLSYWLFARNSNVSSLFYPAKMKSYSFILRYKTVAGISVVRDYIPVLWHSGKSYIDGNTGQTVTPSADKPGMFDKVSKRLFVNQGTGADFLYA